MDKTVAKFNFSSRLPAVKRGRIAAVAIVRLLCIMMSVTHCDSELSRFIASCTYHLITISLSVYVICVFMCMCISVLVLVYVYYVYLR